MIDETCKHQSYVEKRRCSAGAPQSPRVITDIRIVKVPVTRGEPPLTPGLFRQWAYSPKPDQPADWSNPTWPTSSDCPGLHLRENVWARNTCECLNCCLISQRLRISNQVAFLKEKKGRERRKRDPRIECQVFHCCRPWIPKIIFSLSARRYHQGIEQSGSLSPF